MTPSPEPVTCGPPWSLPATLLLTVTLTRSPHPTARDPPPLTEHQMAPHGALTQPSENFGKGELVRKRRSERKRATEHANSAKHKGASVYLSGHPSRSRPYLVWVCVCECVHMQRDIRLITRTVYRWICRLNANRLVVLQHRHLNFSSSTLYFVAHLSQSTYCKHSRPPEWCMWERPHREHCEGPDSATSLCVT